MAKRDHDAIIITECKGLYARDDVMAPPRGYLSQAQNVVYGRSIGANISAALISRSRIVGMREDFKNYATLSNGVNDRFSIYEKSDGDRIIYIDNAGNIRDHTAAAIILTVAAGSKFSGLTLNNRFYFTIGEDLGVSGQFVYVYDPSLSATARKIAGTKPGAGLAAAVSVTAGTIEPGQHIYAVSFITNTGFITPPSSHVILTSPDPRKKTSLTGIPTGGASITKRRVWMSQVIRHFDGNITAVPLFFVGDINDNVTTTATVDAFDSQLVSSADPYLDTLEEVPAGAWLNMFDGRMVSCGEFSNSYLIRVSNQNEPESFGSINGLREIDKYSGGAVTTTRSLKGNLYCWKLNRTYVVHPVSFFPSEWKWEIVDTDIGASTRSVSEVNNSANPYLDMLLVGNSSGLYLFDGTYVNRLRPLSYNIDYSWRFFLNPIGNAGVIRSISVDPIDYRLYILMVSPGSTIIMYMDFLNGLTFDDVKWAIWPLSNYPTANSIVDMHCRKGVLYTAFIDSTSIRSLSMTNLVNITGADDGQIGPSDMQIGFAIADPELRLIHCNGVKAWMGISSSNFSWLVNGTILNSSSQNLAIGDPSKVYENKFNAEGQILEVVITKNGSGRFYLSDIIMFTSPLYQEAPQ